MAASYRLSARSPRVLREAERPLPAPLRHSSHDHEQPFITSYCGVHTTVFHCIHWREALALLAFFKRPSPARSHQMSDQYLLDAVPFWLFFVLACLLTLAAIEAGLWLGARRRRIAEHEQEGPVGTVVGAVLGLLAF